MPGRESVAFQGWRKANESLFTSTVKHSCCLDFRISLGINPPEESPKSSLEVSKKEV